MSIQTSEEPLSLTRVASLFEDKEITRDLLCRGLVADGLLKDIRTIGAKGEAYGVSMCITSRGQWPVYNSSCQRYIETRVAYYKEQFLQEVCAANPRGRKAASSSGAAVTNSSRSSGASARHTAPSDTAFQAKREDVYSTDDALFRGYRYLGIGDFVILDTETTGMCRNDEVIELAVLDMDGCVLYHSYFDPDADMNPFAQRVHGIRKESLAGKPKFPEEWEKIKAAIGGKRVLGHNIKFDKKLIWQSLERYGYSGADVDTVFYGMLDSVQIARAHIETDHYNLNDLTTLVGITREEQHNAADDCLMTLQFLRRLEDILTIKNEYGFIR